MIFGFDIDWIEIWNASEETMLMLCWSMFFTLVIGLPLGIFLFLTSKKQLLANNFIYGIVGAVVNILRSIPFIILVVIAMPASVFLVGTSLGVKGAIPPLVIGAAPFFARLIETALREIDKGILEAIKAMGATTWQTIWNVLIPEALPGIMAAVTVTAITLVSYSAMAGVIGGGGLGDLAIRYGIQRFQTDIMIITVVLLVILVQIMQMLGDKLVIYFSHK